MDLTEFHAVKEETDENIRTSLRFLIPHQRVFFTSKVRRCELLAGRLDSLLLDWDDEVSIVESFGEIWLFN